MDAAAFAAPVFKGIAEWFDAGFYGKFARGRFLIRLFETK